LNWAKGTIWISIKQLAQGFNITSAPNLFYTKLQLKIEYKSQITVASQL
jgi:thioredoxin-related protein